MPPRPDLRDLRASDQDRDRLTPDEHSHRVSAALSARTLGDLAGLTANLAEPSGQPVRIDGGGVITGFFGTEVRAGRWVANSVAQGNAPNQPELTACRDGIDVLSCFAVPRHLPPAPRAHRSPPDHGFVPGFCCCSNRTREQMARPGERTRHSRHSRHSRRAAAPERQNLVQSAAAALLPSGASAQSYLIEL
jgi:hypothetical protein